MSATHTANGAYQYNKLFYGKPLSDWVQDAHKHNCAASGWQFNPLKPGAFGYDNLACSIGYAFDNAASDDIMTLADLVHRGWCINYAYWRDNRPYESDKRYIAPYNPIGDERRNTCAVTAFNDLPDDEKAKDITIAEFLVSAIRA